MGLGVRRVVTGFDGDGRAAIIADATAPGTGAAQDGPGYCSVLWLDAPPTSPEEGGDEPAGPFSLEPPAGGLCARVIRLPPPAPGTSPEETWLRVPGDDPARPGMHTTDTLDFMVVLDGHIVLGLDDGEYRFGPGDMVVQRGTAHRWRVIGQRPCTYAVAMLRPGPALDPSPVPLSPRLSAADAQVGPRRVVTGTEGGRSIALSDGRPPVAVSPAGPDGPLLADLWQTGGALRSCDQGGDPDDWVLEPSGKGAAFRLVEFPPSQPPSGDAAQAGWHTTATIDIDIILAGQLQLELRDRPPVRLNPGDVVVQRGTEHRWTPAGDQRVQMAAVMIALT